MKITNQIRERNFKWLHILVHVAVWSLLAWLLLDYLTGNLTFNPIQAATQRLGRYSLILLLVTLNITPLNTLFGLRQTIPLRRTLGLYTFMLVAIHFTMFVYVDFGLDLSLLKIEFLEKRYIWVGLSAGIILATLAVTSFKWWMKKLGKNWKRLHRFVYLAGVLVILHYGWAKKGDLFRLQGDMVDPIAAGIVLAVLLVLRIPAVRRAITNYKGRLKRRMFTNKERSGPSGDPVLH